MKRKERRIATKTGKHSYETPNTALFAVALRHYQVGQIKEAHQLCQQILAADANDINALHLTGLIAVQTGLYQVAINVLSRAIALNGKIPALHNTIGEALRGLGHLAEATAHYRRAIVLEPRFAPAHNSLGYALILQGKLDEAVAAFRRAVVLAPDNALAHNNLGAALTSQGKFDEAAASCRRALALLGDYVEAHNNLGNALREKGELEEAASCYRQALALRPGYATGHNNLGIILRDQGKFNAAAEAFRQALALAPNYAEAHNNLGSALWARGDTAEAIASYRRALAVGATYADAHNNLGTALLDQGELAKAVASYRQALALQPNLVAAHVNLGIALREQGFLADAIAAQRAALACRPANEKAMRRDASAQAELVYTRALACDWTEAAAETEQLLAAVRRGAEHISPLVLLTLPSTPADQLKCARRWVRSRTAPAPVQPKRRSPAASDKIRLGYLSADFRDDPVSVLLAELIERHDRTRFDVAAYCYGQDDPGEMRRRLRAACDRFTDLRSSNTSESARRIESDGVDILIDLMGHTRQARAGILASRPAPIQVNYLGYPGTMGADYVDYAIVDPYLVPMDQQPFYAERLVQLPDCYQPSDTRRPTAERVPSRAECGLPAHGFVLCCFNNSAKITPAFFDIWMRLLRRVPGSVLWLVAPHALVAENLRREAVARGVEPERLVFAPRVPMASYLPRLQVADLFLDTFPYNAGATANDALWAGLPLLTCSGATYVGRMAGSLLRAAGLPELITQSPEEYEALALRLTTEPSLLAELRQRLARDRATMPLFDIARYTRHIEAAYARMMEIRQRGEAPSAFAVHSAPV